jgi:hypothetical protein
MAARASGRARSAKRAHVEVEVEAEAPAPATSAQAAWSPPDWEKAHAAIVEMRKARDAPVDT